MNSFRLRLWPAFLLAFAISTVVILRLVTAHAERRSLEESYPSTNYSRIEEGLYVGGILSEPPLGTVAVLNVCETNDPYRAKVHRWQPIPDLGPAPSLDWLRSQVDFIDEQRDAGRVTYVHCRAGVNRSVMVVAAYLMRRDGITRDEALETIHNKRSTAGPFPVYMDLLSEWETALK